ncbi:DNA mismatch repair protein MutS [Amylibacter ulvae]|uniref:DNA mismatch repair protein MutS n=1 Tax=Paramylibacter ulvae TaxID=1651968 RepID=A0ABQ3CX69_9RHOB|nr:Smr/MutS family protein [Amylibacter ulvae]GHA48216.1 DNA mismatch repair protein MutS [Amylibacter ulvae]
MARGKNKGLSNDDIAIWKQIADGVKPLSPRKVIPKPIKTAKTLRSTTPITQSPIQPFHIGDKVVETRKGSGPDFREAPAKTSPNMDKRNFQRLLKGKMEIEATLDLHGMTYDQAQKRITMFIRQSHVAGLRMILVITGKGRTHGVDEFNRPKGGVLRQSLPDWLRSPALNHLVLQVTPAQQRHGGAGAWYVYLRRLR